MRSAESEAMPADEPRVFVGYPCPQCDGTGQVQGSSLTLSDAEPPRWVQCTVCRGTGNRKEAWVPLSKLKHMLDEA